MPVSAAWPPRWAGCHERIQLPAPNALLLLLPVTAAYSRHSAVLAGNLFSVLTTFSTLGGLAQGGLAYAAKDIRTQATELLTSTKGLQLAIDKLLLPPGTKLAMKLAAQSMERTAGNLLTLADGGHIVAALPSLMSNDASCMQASVWPHAATAQQQLPLTLSLALLCCGRMQAS